MVEPNPSGSAPTTPVNVARASNGGTASASSTHSSGNYGVAGTINGDRKGTGWGSGTGGWNDNTSNSYPDWLQVTFDASKSINEIDVFTIQDNETSPSEPTEVMTFTQDGIIDFDVQYWNGTAWTTVTGGSVTGNNKVWRKFTFTAVTTDKIRVVVNWSHNAAARYSRIAELEAWTAPVSVNASGSVFDPGTMRTEYAYDRLDKLTQVTQGAQTRSFKYDSLGQLTRQKLAEQTATISDAGCYVTTGCSGPSLWSDAFSYDGRGNLVQRTDARGVKSNFSYDISSSSDPLNRLHGISYDKTGADTTYTINDAADVSIQYMTTGDKSRVSSVTTSGISVETNTYDAYGRVTDYEMALVLRPGYEFLTSYQYDTAQYAYPVSQTHGASSTGSPHRITTTAEYSYDTGLVTEATDANGLTSQTWYNPNTLRPVKSVSSTGAYSTFGYDDDAMTVTEEVFESGGTIAGSSVKYLNGIGQVRKSEAAAPSSIVDIVETKYTLFGEEWKQSRPYRSGDTVQWSEKFYDNQRRLIKVVEPDGSETKAFYNETAIPSSAATAPGNKMRVMTPGDESDEEGTISKAGSLRLSNRIPTQA